MAVFVSTTNSSKERRTGGNVGKRGFSVKDYNITPEGEAFHQSISISQLQPHLPNTIVVGLVINKQSVHSFPDKRNPGNIRYKMTFTIRDSATDFINITCWGNESYVNMLSQSFKIFDVVEIHNCQVSSKLETDDKWNPWTPSPYQLAVNERYSTINIYNGSNYSQLSSLAHIPLRPSNDYYTLSDIFTNGQSLDGSLLNILAAIGSVGAPQQMTSKSGKVLRKCEVSLFDEGCSRFDFTIWDNEMIELAQTWIPKENIIFAVDVKVSFNSFKNTMSGTCINKTLITTNPDCPYAHHLYQYAQSVELDDTTCTYEDGSSGSSGGSVNLQTIKDVFTIEQLERFKKGSNDFGDFSRPSMGITYAYLTLLDIDRDPTSVTTHRCSVCRFKVLRDLTVCCNQSCSSLVSGDGFMSELVFDLYISLADHTGTVDNVKLTGPVAVDLLCKTPTEFLSMTEEERIDLKVSLLLERYKVYFKLNTTGDQKRAFVRILSIEPANPNEVVAHLQP